MRRKNKSSYEGLQKKVRSMQTPQLEVWTNQYADRRYIINLEISEFTCICPKTGLPDFARIYINYSPGRWCLELKSLKLYLNWYRNLGIFHEHLINRIAADLVKSCRPRWLEIIGEFNPRGGIKTTVKKEYGRKK